MFLTLINLFVSFSFERNLSRDVEDDHKGTERQDKTPPTEKNERQMDLECNGLKDILGKYLKWSVEVMLWKVLVLERFNHYWPKS